jgi:transcriptional regulator with XRE-family HTH domain
MVMAQAKTLTEWMTERGIRLSELVEASALDERVVAAIAHGRYTPSAQQRQRLSAALGIEPEQVLWGHVAQVEHMYGHGPQFGRSP